MAKTKVAPARPKKQAQSAPHEAVDGDDTLVALSKAHAAWWLLDEMANGGLVRPAAPAPPERDTGLEEIEGWISVMTLNTLHDALEEAEAAFRRSQARAAQVEA